MRIRIALALGLLLAGMQAKAAAPDSNHRATQVRFERRALLGLGTGVAFLLSHLWHTQVWWPDSLRGPWQIRIEGPYALHLDKLGHFYAASVLSDTYWRALQWAGFSADRSALYSAVLVTLFAAYIEFFDGYGRTYGADPIDWLFGALGAWWAALRSRHPGLQAVALKWSYWPSAGFKHAFVDDYEGHNYWLVFYPHRLGLGPPWPRWLGIALGVGGKHLRSGDRPTPEDRRRRYLEWMFALDYDLAHLARSPWGFLLRLLEPIHGPAPTLRLRPGFRPWVGLLWVSTRR
ncbi:MAG: DUF2279 domain-containing protein [Bacteroidota bacterium]|nr:YfiM family protein [Rhodothermia bacterium]MCS7154592.1 YfiM family protein [Bacteroidota bacterium]MDW8137385.1 DUF2279 domain-containing protein [Bacteroidota bacterium]MDW8285661.1 DUF2279 domain-containing protein [Bacteroidota bacterium]